MIHHIVNVSAGKDSTACYLLALERGKPFRPVMFDTGHENEITVDYANRLGDRTGGPAVEVFRADFSHQIEGKRRFVETKWREQGVPEEIVQRALAVLVPTGIPFLDLCIWKGRFPSRKAQFCTEELKANPAEAQVIGPALESGPVIQWIGVRRDESLNRRNAPLRQIVRRADKPHDLMFWRPLIHWTAEDCFALHAKHGLEPNPLYRLGMGRVGCFPCINVSKGEMAQIATRFPEAIEIVAEWETIVAAASKRGLATFFASDVTPEGARAGKAVKAGRIRAVDVTWPDVRAVAEWARTSRGGRQFQLGLEPEPSCSSQYGLCE